MPDAGWDVFVLGRRLTVCLLVAAFIAMLIGACNPIVILMHMCRAATGAGARPATGARG